MEKKSSTTNLQKAGDMGELKMNNIKIQKCEKCAWYSQANHDTFSYCMRNGDHSPVLCEYFKEKN